MNGSAADRAAGGGARRRDMPQGVGTRIAEGIRIRRGADAETVENQNEGAAHQGLPFPITRRCGPAAPDRRERRFPPG
jgi:hypothetical protein